MLLFSWSHGQGVGDHFGRWIAVQCINFSFVHHSQLGDSTWLDVKERQVYRLHRSIENTIYLAHGNGTKASISN